MVVVVVRRCRSVVYLYVNLSEIYIYISYKENIPGAQDASASRAPLILVVIVIVVVICHPCCRDGDGGDDGG